MTPVRVVEGRAVPLDRADVDTDQIMPKQYLKRIERTGFGEYLFAHWRADPAFVLNDARYAGATVLVAGPNFGCGSSREHAPWGIQQYGFEAVVAPSFADIFRTNCAQTGLLAVELPGRAGRQLLELVTADPETVVRIDLEAQELLAWGSAGGLICSPSAPAVRASFGIDSHTKHLLLHGLDDIELTLAHDDDIAGFESRRPRWLPTTTVP